MVYLDVGCSPALQSYNSSTGDWSEELGVLGWSVSYPVGSRTCGGPDPVRSSPYAVQTCVGFICSSRSRVVSRISHLCNNFAPFFFSFLLFPRLPSYYQGVGQVSLIYCVFVFLFFYFLVAGDRFCKTKLDMMTSFIFGEHAATYAIYSR